jgi:hypothetical protein
MYTTTLKRGQKPTAEQLKHIEDASSLPIIDEDDCPVYSAEQLSKLYDQSHTPDINVTLHLAPDV